MSERTAIEDWAIDEFSELVDLGFSKPAVTHEHWSTAIDWLHSDIAVELELDWREFDAFLLIVRLENGRLPQGYYVSNGKPCRYHLQKIVKERAWPVDSEAMKEISTVEKSRRPREPSAETMKQRLLAYKAVLMSCVDRIIADSAAIFST